MDVKTGTVGIDLDTHDGYVLVKTVLMARQYGRVSTDYTGKGFHLTVELKEPVTLGQALHLRRILGDDPVRLEYDEAKLRHGNPTGFDTLFTHKNGRTVRRIDSGI